MRIFEATVSTENTKIAYVGIRDKQPINNNDDTAKCGVFLNDGETRMDNEKKIKILEKENIRLQEEVKRLKEELQLTKTMSDRYEELDNLKNAWKKEIADIQILREKYTELIGQLHSFKEIQDKLEK